ncbi:MAG: DUF2961 domain-containing protein [Planctomycetes bacterium]|nr:DUF2961 domain-containing protein [Planctomycetota bacterium]
MPAVSFALSSLLAVAGFCQAESVVDFARLPLERVGRVRVITSQSPEADRTFAEKEGTLALTRSVGHRGRLARLWLVGGHPRAKLRAYFDGSIVPAFAERLAIGFEDGRPPLLSFWTFGPDRAAGARVSYPPLSYRSEANVTISSAVTAYEIELVEDEPTEQASLPPLAQSASFDLPSVEIPPGEARPLGEADGEGTVELLTLIPEVFTDGDLATSRLRITFDGAASPQIDASLEHLFARTKLSVPLEGLAVRVAEAELQLRLPMPFARGCRVELRNDGARTVKLRATADVSRGSLTPQSLRLSIREWKSSGSAIPLAQVRGGGHWLGFTCRSNTGASAIASGHLVVEADGAVAYRSISMASAFDGGETFGKNPYLTIGVGLTEVEESSFHGLCLRLTRPIRYQQSLRAAAMLPSGVSAEMSGASFGYERAAPAPKAAPVGASGTSR